MMSVAAFGGHAYFYSDSTVLAEQASEVAVIAVMIWLFIAFI
jgi:hypothetical protein